MASSRKMRVVLLALEWGSKLGGLSTFNRELAIHLAKHPEVQVSVFVPRCDQEEKNAAQRDNVTLVQATSRPGYEEIDWLCFPPDDLQIDFVIGHGVTLGRQAQVIRRIRQCKWIQFVLTEPEKLNLIKDYSDTISKGKEEHQGEEELCKLADFVVAVGPKLADAYRHYLRRYGKEQKVFVLTPGIFSEFCRVKQREQDGSKCRVLAVGRGNAEDFSLTGFDIAATAVGLLKYVHLIVVGARTERRHELAIRFQEECGIPRERLSIRNFTETRERLMDQFSDVDLVIMPSRIGDFGLVALEAMSAHMPVLVSASSGFGEALRKVAFGSTCVIHSENADVWTEEIEKFWEKERHVRLEEAKAVRDSYAQKYSWEEQCKDFVEEMRNMLDGDSITHDPERPAPSIVETEGVPTSKRKLYSPDGASVPKKTKSSQGASVSKKTKSSPDHRSSAAQSSEGVTAVPVFKVVPVPKSPRKEKHLPGVSEQTQTEPSLGAVPVFNVVSVSEKEKPSPGVSEQTQTESPLGEHRSTTTQSSGDQTEDRLSATPRDVADRALSPLAIELEKTLGKLGDE